MTSPSQSDSRSEIRSVLDTSTTSISKPTAKSPSSLSPLLKASSGVSPAAKSFRHMQLDRSDQDTPLGPPRLTKLSADSSRVNTFDSFCMIWASNAAQEIESSDGLMEDRNGNDKRKGAEKSFMLSTCFDELNSPTTCQSITKRRWGTEQDFSAQVSDPTDKSLSDSIVVASGNSTSQKNQRWAEHEDDLLKLAIEQLGGPPHNWKSISATYFNGRRSDIQCKSRWKKVLNPTIDHSPFTSKEDQFIVQQRHQERNWSDIAAMLPGRIPEQIRDRFMNHVDPALKTTPWTEEERKILLRAQKQFGNKWSKIAKLLPGRSENTIKNCWYNHKTSQHRAIRRMASSGNLAREISLDNINESKSASLGEP